MSLQFEAQIETSINYVAFEECFNGSFDQLKNDLPWDTMKKDWGEEDLTKENIYSYLKSYFEEMASNNNIKNGFVFSVTNTDKSVYYAYFTAVVKDGTATLAIMMFNTVDGSKMWTYEFFKTTALKSLLESVGASRWKTHVYGAATWNSASMVLPNEGVAPGEDGNRVGIIRSSYGW